MRPTCMSSRPYSASISIVASSSRRRCISTTWRPWRAIVFVTALAMVRHRGSFACLDFDCFCHLQASCDDRGVVSRGGWQSDLGVDHRWIERQAASCYRGSAERIINEIGTFEHVEFVFPFDYGPRFSGTTGDGFVRCRWGGGSYGEPQDNGFRVRADVAVVAEQ